MTKVLEYREIPLDDLVISKGQARTQNVGKEIEELASSIRAQGLLQPIVVCEANKEGKWEILTGQRRFLAHKYLEMESIVAAVLDERVDEGQAKAISITENLIRRQLSGKELKDGILYLYNLYGSVNDVKEATGLPAAKIRAYVKFPRLMPELKDLVEDGTVNINVAVKAQDASIDENGDPNPEVAVPLAREMDSMSGVQRTKLIQEHSKSPEKPMSDLIEEARTGGKVTQIVATVTHDTHKALQKFASDEGSNQDEAAVLLIEEALVERGLLSG